MTPYERRPRGVFYRGPEVSPGVFDDTLARLVLPEHGEPWAAYHAWLAIPGNVPDAPPPPPPQTLEFVIAEKLAVIEAHAYAQRAKVTLPASPQEMASWSLKLAEARAWKASQDDADAPMLALEGVLRGTGTADIVARVLENAQGYQRAEGAIAGTCGRHKDAVRALATVEEVLAYDVTAGWPLEGPGPVGDRLPPPA